MKSSDLERWQIEAIQKVIGPTVGYLCKTRKRMDKLRFPVEDRVYQEGL